MRLVREFECCAGWAWCACSDSCALEVKVEAPVGNVVGYVKQSKYCSGPKFDVLDAERRPVAKIKGPYCMQLNSFCKGEIDFDVFTVDMATTIGKVFKQRPGCFLKECCTKVDNVGVTFPADLDVNVKATLLAAVFFIVSCIFILFLHQKQHACLSCGHPPSREQNGISTILYTRHFIP
eukprot:XP_011678222.1 PREDICTED: phospholipid scramblase 3-like [Strongylocentrotus purpuratus]